MGGANVEGNEMIFDKKKNSRCVKMRALLSNFALLEQNVFNITLKSFEW